MSAVATHPSRDSLRRRAAAIPAWAITTAGLAVLLIGSLILRTTALHAGFWIDEGLSVGIASHHFWDIPSVLRQDGSPPLYYLILGVWMRVFSDGQATTHVLSLLFALATVPVAFWAGTSLFDRRSGWFCALLATLNPFLTYYAQETRMYALVSLLALIVVATFAHAFAFGRRAFVAPFGLSLVMLMYTHNWGLFLAVGTVVALVPVWRASRDRRALVRDVLTGYGIAGVLYLPWLPTLAFQAAHTGAPWSTRPSLADVFGPLSGILGGPGVPLALALAGGAGLATMIQRRTARGSAERVAAEALILLPLSALALAWLASQLSPAFTGRYFAVFVGPVMLLAGAGLAHAGRLGLVCLCVVLALWIQPRTAEIEGKSDARLVAAKLAPGIERGDMIVSVHPEQAPLMHYYLSRAGVHHLRWATSLGPMADPKVFDWVDALDKLRAAESDATLDDLVSGLRPGQTLALVLPIIRTASWNAPWTKLVRRRAAQWQRAADRNPRLVRLGPVVTFKGERLPRGVRAIRYRVRAVASSFTTVSPG